MERAVANAPRCACPLCYEEHWHLTRAAAFEDAAQMALEVGKACFFRLNGNSDDLRAACSARDVAIILHRNGESERAAAKRNHNTAVDLGHPVNNPSNA